MQAAKNAVQNLVANHGHHKTTVEESVAPAVVQEQVHKHAHEEVQTVVEKEVHQDHHHTTIQPIKDQKVLAEEHHHNMVPVTHKEFNHKNDAEVRAALEREQAKFRDTRIEHNTTHSTSQAPVVEAERIHHHVHEHVQPVIERDVVANKVIHTTVPVHEKHIAAAEFHGTSVLPAKTLSEFQSTGGVLKGRDTVGLTEFDGCPKPYNKEFQSERREGDKSMHLHSEHFHNHHNGAVGAGALGATGAAGAVGATRHRRGSNSSSSSSDNDGTKHSSRTNRKAGLAGATGTTGTIGTTGTNITTKPSLVDKLNPFKDSDHDGRKGIMD